MGGAVRGEECFGESQGQRGDETGGQKGTLRSVCLSSDRLLALLLFSFLTSAIMNHQR